ncbi:MAG TPA: P1 family peptidase [Thermomicrobiaceae bacterium]|nr:P1 family peptidase [Thermomicrobiaceae bacterium]
MEITDGPFMVDGFLVGHWTHPTAATGCTVVVAERPALAVADVRGGAPGTRELAVLDQGRLVQRVDAVLLSGGSAFGLAAADGVVDWLSGRGRGFPTASVPVPIVPAAVIFDLEGPTPVVPRPESGFEAAENAVPEGWISGAVGAGAGARSGKARGRGHSVRAGIGSARLAVEGGAVAALMVVNAFGDVVSAESGEELSAGGVEDALLNGGADSPPGTNTTIGVVVVEADVDRDALVRIAVAAHDGLARAIRPSHTLVDGDTIFVLSVREGHAETATLLRLTAAAQIVVARATRNSVSAAR